MPVNANKVTSWKQDVAASVDMYNSWFMNYAPTAFRTTRVQTTQSVERALFITNYLADISPATLAANPSIISTLRMSTCPPIAVDRLIGLAGVNPSMVKSMELLGRVPPRMNNLTLLAELGKVAAIIERMADPDIFVWLARKSDPEQSEIHRAATIVADRLCGAVANPIIRNAQEQRQLAAIEAWLNVRGYKKVGGTGLTCDNMLPGTYSFRMNVPVRLETGDDSYNIPVDAVIKPLKSVRGQLPLFFEAKSAGDFANTNKRRKEEAVKVSQLRRTFGAGVSFNLFLCGYFDCGYLGYEAAEGIDWVWEHRIDDLAAFGL
jgi:type II restriction enzyme